MTTTKPKKDLTTGGGGAVAAACCRGLPGREGGRGDAQFSTPGTEQGRSPP
jgi:hypothetical protein